MRLHLLSAAELPTIVPLAQELNPGIDKAVVDARAREMFTYAHYLCFGCKIDDRLIGISSGWLTTRLYSGKQLELDNVVITHAERGRGRGIAFLTLIEAWAKDQGCDSVELNTYVTNSRSHKLYHTLGYRILGFHFQKQI
jgi:GNAT superfamily N-acetyltransferase